MPDFEFCLGNNTRRFLKTSDYFYGILIVKISGNTVEAKRQTTHDAKSKQVSKKLKESDRNENKELCCLTKNCLNIKGNKYVVIKVSVNNFSSDRFFKQCQY